MRCGRRQGEPADQCRKFFGPLAQSIGGSRRLLDQRRVLLRHFVELGHGLVDLPHLTCLGLGGAGNFADGAGNLVDRFDDAGHAGAGFQGKNRSGLHALHRTRYQFLDFASGGRRTQRQLSHFCGHHGKPATSRACACSFNRRIERQDVGLKCDPVDHADDLRHAARRQLDLLHLADDLGHHLTTVLRCNGRTVGHLFGAARRVRRLLQVARHQLKRHCGLLQVGGGAVGPAGEVGVALGHVGRRQVERLRAVPNLRHQRAQLLLHGSEGG